MNTSNNRVLTAFLNTHEGHALDLTNEGGIVVVACTECHTCDVIGATTDAQREAALTAHTETIAAALMTAQTHREPSA